MNRGRPNSFPGKEFEPMEDWDTPEDQRRFYQAWEDEQQRAKRNDKGNHTGDKAHDAGPSNHSSRGSIMDGPDFPNFDGVKSSLGPLPLIQVTRNSFVSNAEEGEQALLLAEAPVYRRFNKLTRPIDLEVDAAPESTPDGPVARKTHAPGLIEICQPIMRQMLHQSATWMKYDARSKKLLPIAPPHEAANLILNRVGFWPFSDVNGIIATPVMRRDGSILDQAGYDPATGLILHNPPPMPPDFNHNPTKADAERSLMRLKNDLLRGFPFVDEASCSVALSGLITPMCRAAIRQSPMHVANAPAAGTGKSYLWDQAATSPTAPPCR